jgi:SAM-dependent methyltransferase
MNREDWDERYAAAELVWSAEPNRFVEAEIEGLAPGRALELAAGEGRNAIWLAENGWTVTAVDFSRVAMQKAAHLAAARGITIELAVADVTEDAPESGVYDLVLVAYLQTPPPDRERWLGHAVRALAPGGTLLLVGHDRSNLEHGYGGPQDAGVLTTPEELRAALLAGGLDVEKAELAERAVVTADGPRTAIDHVVRARRPRAGQ